MTNSQIAAKSKIFIDGASWTIKLIKKPMVGWEESTAGECIPADKLIYMLDWLPPQKAAKALRHEVVHMALHRWRGMVLTTEVQELIATEYTRIYAQVSDICDGWTRSGKATIRELFVQE